MRVEARSLLEASVHVGYCHVLAEGRRVWGGSLTRRGSGEGRSLRHSTVVKGY
jgi:hypothetical protein